MEEIFVKWERWGHKGYYITPEQQQLISEYNDVFVSAVPSGIKPVTCDAGQALTYRGYHDERVYTILFCKIGDKLYFALLMPPFQTDEREQFAKDHFFITLQSVVQPKHINEFVKQQNREVKKQL